MQLISQRVGRCLERQDLLEQDGESAWLDPRTLPRLSAFWGQRRPVQYTEPWFLCRVFPGPVQAQCALGDWRSIQCNSAHAA